MSGDRCAERGGDGGSVSGRVDAVDARGLRHAYPNGRVALDGVDLRVGAGERVAVLGPNGAGKTTLMLHLNGLLRPSAGALSVAGIAAPARKALSSRPIGNL